MALSNEVDRGKADPRQLAPSIAAGTRISNDFNFITFILIIMMKSCKECAKSSFSLLRRSSLPLPRRLRLVRRPRFVLHTLLHGQAFHDIAERVVAHAVFKSIFHAALIVERLEYRRGDHRRERLLELLDGGLRVRPVHDAVAVAVQDRPKFLLENCLAF